MGLRVALEPRAVEQAAVVAEMVLVQVRTQPIMALVAALAVETVHRAWAAMVSRVLLFWK